MEGKPENPILTFHDNTLNEVRKSINLDKPGAMKAAIDILELWLKKQDHFVTKDFSRNYLERVILVNKGSLERAKERLDRICTARTLLPELFSNCNLQDFGPDKLLYALLPKLTSDNCRGCFLKISGDTFTLDIYFKFYMKIIRVIEYAFAHDYNRGLMLIFDYRTANIMESIKGLDISVFRKFCRLLFNSYGLRVKTIHLISASKVVNLLVNIGKPVLTKKMASRLYVHSKLEMLYEHVEKDILPKEYGGKEKSLKELNDMWLDILNSKEHLEYIKKMNAAKTDESLRKTVRADNKYLGMSGSLRSLTID